MAGVAHDDVWVITGITHIPLWTPLLDIRVCFCYVCLHSADECFWWLVIECFVFRLFEGEVVM